MKPSPGTLEDTEVLSSVGVLSSPGRWLPNWVSLWQMAQSVEIGIGYLIEEETPR